MKKCYEYQTSIGRFYIVEYENRYHAVYFGISICNCSCAAEVAAVLGDGFKFSLLGSALGEIDTTILGIPADLTKWIQSYFMPDEIRENFTNHTDSISQNAE